MYQLKTCRYPKNIPVMAISYTPGMYQINTCLQVKLSIPKILFCYMYKIYTCGFSRHFLFPLIHSYMNWTGVPPRQSELVNDI